MSFENDLGLADESLLATLQRFADAPDTTPRQVVLEELRGKRLLIPVVDTGESEMQGVVFTSVDGRKGLPAFTSAAALALWRADARPLPQFAGFLALHCLKESLDALLIDMASEHRFAVQGIELAVVASDPTAEHLPPSRS